MITRFARRARTALRLGRRRQALAIEAAAQMLVARVAVRMLPFRRVARGLGTFVAPQDDRIAAVARPVGDRLHAARDVAWAVRTVAPALPFRAVCLQQAIAAQAMLRRRGIASTMHFGVTGSERGLELAHAWLDAGGVCVTGYPLDPALVELGCFV